MVRRLERAARRSKPPNSVCASTRCRRSIAFSTNILRKGLRRSSCSRIWPAAKPSAAQPEVWEIANGGWVFLASGLFFVSCRAKPFPHPSQHP